MTYPDRTDKIVEYGDWDGWVQKGFDFRAFIRQHFGKPLPADTDLRSEVTSAYINEGRWIADCPAGCGNALRVTPSDPLFFCPNCGQGWFDIVFPSIRDRLDIEAELMKRPLVGGAPLHRNWNVGETLDDLMAETVRLRA